MAKQAEENELEVQQSAVRQQASNQESTDRCEELQVECQRSARQAKGNMIKALEELQAECQQMAK